MNILILSCAFERPYCNARLRSQCEYLTQQGHLVKVYTEPWDTINFKHEYSINELGENDEGYFKWIFQSISSFFTNYKERKFAYQVLWYSRRIKYDLVYCSTNVSFPLSAAAIVAKVKNIPLHVDLWDIDELDPSHTQFSWWHPFKLLHQRLTIKRRNAALAQAQTITTVSPSHAKIIRTINPNVEVLYNGFDPNQFTYNPIKTDTFRIIFFGPAFFSQNINMILHIMENFGNELPKVQWTFYSNDLNYNHIKYSCPNICGVLPKEVIPNAMNQASLVLLFNDTEDNGLSSEQFYQALGAERPMLFTNTATGAVPDMIALTHAGLATNNIQEAMDYIRELYHQWEKDGYTHIDIENKDLFNTNLQWQRLEQMLSTCKK